MSPEDLETERTDLSTVVLKDRLIKTIDNLNPDIPSQAREEAVKKILNLPNHDLYENNELFHTMLVEGITVEYQKDGNAVGDTVKLIDFDNPHNNDLIVTNQYTVVTEGYTSHKTKRPDVVLLINGLPLVVIELKNAIDENATVHKAYTQLQNYKKAISKLFNYNSLLIASDGLDAKAGSLTSGWERFMAWKTVDGQREDPATVPQIETMIKGMLRPDVLFDLIKHFTVFEKSEKQDKKTGLTTVTLIKKIAAYHQYHVVNQAVKSTVRATSEEVNILRVSPAQYGLSSTNGQTKGDQRVGVVWHTQGSGKSLSMVFYTGKLVVEPAMHNPTVVVITDRNDLDDQLFNTFANSKQLLRQEPVQAKNRDDLKNLLDTAGGGIIFTTIQKFFPEEGEKDFQQLSTRKNIVVVADEAHRSQYGFSAKTIMKDDMAITKYGFAKYLRDAIPRASFIGFTGTPIEKQDASTRAVFGNYIDIYDISRAVEDGATVKIFYESRLAKIKFDKDKKEELDNAVDELVENENQTAYEKAKTKWSQLEAIVGHKDRVKTVASDIVTHFETRTEIIEGKGLIVSMSRRIAVELYDAIIAIRPDWHSEDKTKGKIKVVMTSSSSDPESWQMHNTSKQERKDLAARLKDPKDELELVIVRDMWLTGFDAPCLHTMYIDKPMKGHNLMQAIARVNRVYKDKPGGLIVDYIGIASDLKKALYTYTDNGGKGTPTLDQEEAVALMLEKFEIVDQMFVGFDYKEYFDTDTSRKMTLILEAQEHILQLEEGKDRFLKEVTALSKAYALSVPHPKALNIKDELAFFQAIKSRLVKFEPSGERKSDLEIETAIRQLVDQAVVSDGVIDIFDAAGIKKPDLSILSDEFLQEIQCMEHKNVALELLKKLLNDEISTRKKHNLIRSKKLSEMLEASINRYHNNLLTTAQVIEELIKIAKDIKKSDKEMENSGLTYDEIAFYDALIQNGSAKEVLGDDQLRDLSRVLVDKVRKNATIDWTVKESVQAKLRVIVKRILRKYGYPPDQQKLATEQILSQAELFADEWNKNS